MNLELMKNKDDSTWFVACADGDNWVFHANPRGRGHKAKRFNLTLALQKTGDDYTMFGYVSDAGATLHNWAPVKMNKDQAEKVGASFLDAAREADDDLIVWPKR